VALTTSIAVYFIVWWLVLFAVLPWGVRSQEENGAVTPGSDPGAPAVPALWRKLVWTTVASAVIFAIGDGLFRYRLVTLDGLAALLGLPW
jgi:predicted secreted protein